MLRRLLGIIVGAAAYVFLSWIIIVGPIVSGFISGLVAGGGGRRGFSTGLLSSAAGFLAIVALMNATGLAMNGLIEILLLGVFVLANLLGILLSAAGGALGGMVAGVPQPRDGRQKQPENIFQENPASVYVICPTCGHSNGEKDEFCKHCGKRILG